MIGEPVVSIGQDALGAIVTSDNNLTVILVGVDKIPVDRSMR